MHNEGDGFVFLCNKIDEMMISQNEVIVAIDGPCGAGKSSLANRLGGKYKANIFHLDDYFLTPELRTKKRLKDPGGNVDYKRFRKEIILGIKSKKSFSYYKYNCKDNAMEHKKVNEPSPLSVIEGSYSFHPYLIDAYDLKIFLDIEPGIQKDRILKRNGEAAANRFIDEWIPLENLYFEAFSIKDIADLVLDGSFLTENL